LLNSEAYKVLVILHPSHLEGASLLL
jgi:hypothetical protein